MTRIKAAGIHLGISAFVALLVVSAMLLVWYPGAYFGFMGGTGLLCLIVGVDVCLGPLLTFVIFKSGKKGLKFDLAVIAVLQCAALFYGASVMFAARPAYTVFVVDKFRVVAANEIEADEYAKARREEWKAPPLWGPQVIASEMPTDPKEKNDLVFAATAGIDLHQLPKYYAPYDAQRTAILQAAKPLSVLNGLAASNKEKIDGFVRKKGKPAESFVFVPLRANMAFMAAILDAKTGDFVDILDAEPYP